MTVQITFPYTIEISSWSLIRPFFWMMLGGVTIIFYIGWPIYLFGLITTIIAFSRIVSKRLVLTKTEVYIKNVFSGETILNRDDILRVDFKQDWLDVRTGTGILILETKEGVIRFRRVASLPKHFYILSRYVLSENMEDSVCRPDEEESEVGISEGYFCMPDEASGFSGGPCLCAERTGDEGRDEILYILRKPGYIDGYFKILRNVRVPCTPYQKGLGAADVDVVMIHEKGVYVFQSKDMNGWVFGGEEDNLWMEKFNDRSLEFPNPILENKGSIDLLSYVLGKGVSGFVSVIVFGNTTKMNSIPGGDRSCIITRRLHLQKELIHHLQKAVCIYSPEMVDAMYLRLCQVSERAPEGCAVEAGVQDSRSSRANYV